MVERVGQERLERAQAAVHLLIDGREERKCTGVGADEDMLRHGPWLVDVHVFAVCVGYGGWGGGHGAGEQGHGCEELAGVEGAFVQEPGAGEGFGIYMFSLVEDDYFGAGETDARGRIGGRGCCCCHRQ